ncbi:hypothetical protein L1987_82047 [Smallanthus sonchifolius]|uniref:Uncharacterized protein n=1 Tax=Smallanthus sonchifolius TaxID=185202 RepID=A0ACB8YTD1_9ASTR|nr:hypothetical protein L1987_82047 [Smallanthus sonchifolius]
MKSIFMRVLFCKIHCSSFICFCKPSTASHLYNSGPLKLENSPHAPHPSVVTDPSDQNHVEEIKENEISEDGKQESEIEIVVLRSCMKTKRDSQSRSPIDRKKVQWMDNLGKQLVDIKEFESSDTGDTDQEHDNNACFCVIL